MSYVHDDMPCRGDSPVEAWGFWFDEPTPQEACSSLERFAETHAAATIIEAIEITGQKIGLTTETVRLQYINGILRRKVLESVAPERAEAERHIDSILVSWSKANLGTWPLNRKKVSYWHQYCKVEEIPVKRN